MTKNSTELADICRDLEAASHAAGQRLIDAEAAHREAMRSAISTQDYASTSKTQRALEAARLERDRACDTLEIARQLRREALERERLAMQDEARKKLEAALSEMQIIAQRADASLAQLVADLKDLRDREFAASAVVRDAFGVDATHVPQIFSAAGSIGSFFQNLRNLDGMGDMKPEAFVAAAVDRAAVRVRRGAGA